MALGLDKLCQPLQSIPGLGPSKQQGTTSDSAILIFRFSDFQLNALPFPLLPSQLQPQVKATEEAVQE